MTERTYIGPTIEQLSKRHYQITLGEIRGEVGEILPYCAAKAIIEEGNSEDAVNVATDYVMGILFDEDFYREVVFMSRFHNEVRGQVVEYVMENCEEIGGWEWEEYRW